MTETTQQKIADLERRNAELEAQLADVEAARAACAIGDVMVIDGAGIAISVKVDHEGAHPVARLPVEHLLTGGPRTIGEPVLDTIARLEAEVEELRPLPAEHEKRGQILAHVAAALGEVAGVNGTGPGVDPWYYKARAALALAGHHVPELRENHLADIVQAMRDTKEAGAPFRAENVADEVLDVGRHHDLGLWEGWLAQDYPDAPTSAPAHLVNEICPRCQGYGGAPEMRRLLLGEVAKRDRAIGERDGKLEVMSKRWDELRAAADAVAATNKNANARIGELEAALQTHDDARAGAEKATAEIVAHARIQADQIDEGAAMRGQLAAQVALRDQQLAALAKELSEAQVKMREALAEVDRVREAGIAACAQVRAEAEACLARVTAEAKENAERVARAEHDAKLAEIVSRLAKLETSTAPAP